MSPARRRGLAYDFQFSPEQNSLHGISLIPAKTENRKPDPQGVHRTVVLPAWPTLQPPHKPWRSDLLKQYTTRSFSKAAERRQHSAALRSAMSQTLT